MDGKLDELAIRIPKNGSRITFLLLICQAIIFVANLYLSNGYVSKSVYEKDTAETYNRREALNLELRNIAIELRGIKDHMQGDDKQDKRLDDLDQRLRAVERK